MVNMRFSFQTERKLYIVLDYVNGGELFYHLQKVRQTHIYFLFFSFFSCSLFFVCWQSPYRRFHQAKRFDEERARFYAAEVVLVIEYLHSRGIIYRYIYCPPREVLSTHGVIFRLRHKFPRVWRFD